MRRHLGALVGLAVLAAAVAWLVTRPVVRFSLGGAVSLVAEPGVPTFALQEASGRWRLYSAGARGAQDGLDLPDGVLGRPALQADGSACVLTAEGLSWVHAAHPIVPGGEVVPLLGRDALPDGARLVGMLAGTEPLLAAPAGDGLRLLVCQGGPMRRARLVPIMPRDGDGAVPADATLVVSRASRALAFPGAGGWEAWVVDDGGVARRAVADECTDPGAVFTPDGRALIVPGRVGGLWKLDLADGRMNHMAEGNLGISRRVPPSHEFRQVPASAGGMQWVLLAPQWDIEGRLQIYQAHLSGGGRKGLTIGGAHHYGVTLSQEGHLLAYTQSGFDEQGEAPFVEDIYLFDFDSPASAAMLLESRRGGRAGQGPAFVGDGTSLVFLADGNAVRIDVRTPPPEPRP
jgi:hypothetical protein